MGLFTRDEPVIVKDSTSATEQLEQMKALLDRVDPSDRMRLERDIKLQEAGLRGEEQVLFELKNSHLPIHVVRDLYLECDGLSAQIDFLVVMPNCNVILECKNMVGNIEVNDRGDFIRTFGQGRWHKTEGIYSPITQNAHHIELMLQMITKDKSAVNAALYRAFNASSKKSLVVLANEKTLLNDAKALHDVREQIVRRDALATRLKAINDSFGVMGTHFNAKCRLRIAERWIERSSAHEVDLSESYELKAEALQPAPQPVPQPMAQPAPQPVPQQAPQPTPQPAPRYVASSAAAPAPTQTLFCPRCGSKMVLRTAKKGRRAGKQFWGCSTYPRCHCIINVR